MSTFAASLKHLVFTAFSLLFCGLSITLVLIVGVLAPLWILGRFDLELGIWPRVTVGVLAIEALVVGPFSILAILVAIRLAELFQSLEAALRSRYPRLMPDDKTALLPVIILPILIVEVVWGYKDHATMGHRVILYLGGYLVLLVVIAVRQNYGLAQSQASDAPGPTREA